MGKLNFKKLIVFENKDYLGINKPPFVSTLADRKTSVNILSMAKHYAPGAQVCHRLDKETSGILMIAKHHEAYRNLAIQFEDRIVIKSYHAVVNGLHSFQAHEVNSPMRSLKHGIVKIDFKKGKPAQTTFNTIQAYRFHTLVQCFPRTGRMHQIRIHLACIQAPIVGDSQYGGNQLYLSFLKRGFNLKQKTEEQSLIKRVALHAHNIIFYDMEEEEMRIEADYPKDFAVLVKQLDKFS